MAFKERNVHGYALVITSNTVSQLELDGDTMMDDPDGIQTIESITKLDYTDVCICLVFDTAIPLFNSNRITCLGWA